MSTDVLYPSLIGLGCLLLALVVHLLTRPEPSRNDITLPDTRRPTGTGGPREAPDRRPGMALQDWHRTNESTLLAFLEHYDGPTGNHTGTGTNHAPAGDAPTDDAIVLTDPDDREDDETRRLTEAFEQAMDAHPAPEMRAELAALRTAADAMTLARERGDHQAIERHRQVYLTYRSAWLERLWQYPVDRARVAAARNRRVASSASD